MHTANHSQHFGQLVMKGFVICDHLSLGARVGAILERVGRSPGATVHWLVKCSLAEDLNKTAWAEQALLEALDAHLVVIPSRLVQSCPLWFINWLKRWAALRQIPDAAVAMVSDGYTPLAESQVHPDVLEFVQQHGLAFISEWPSRASASAMPSIQSTRERHAPLFIAQRASLDSRRFRSYRDFGINE